MADEKHFYHYFISPCFAPKYPVLQGISGIMVIRSEITDCGKSEQNPASCYYLLVVKLVVVLNHVSPSAISMTSSSAFGNFPFYMPPAYFQISPGNIL